MHATKERVGIFIGTLNLFESNFNSNNCDTMVFKGEVSKLEGNLHALEGRNESRGPTKRTCSMEIVQERSKCSFLLVNIHREPEEGRESKK
jgi:hypothetical protein